jgi:hypothetical protein
MMRLQLTNELVVKDDIDLDGEGRRARIKTFSFGLFDESRPAFDQF